MKKNIFYILYIICFLLIFGQSEKGQAAAQKQFTVVIDPGHGGNDPGAVGKRGREKNINLNVALKLGRLIENNCNDTHVIYTRKKDIFVPLHKRAEIANNAKADLFISIHTNSVASRNSRVCGTETYTLGLHRTQDNLEVAQKENSVILIEDDYKQRYAGFNPNSAESYIIFEFLQDTHMSQSVNFASMIQKQFRQSARRIDKGVHQAGFLVLRETSMPSVLVELGYITNPNEETYLLSEHGSSALAKSIYQAFLNYKQYSRKSSTSISPASKSEKDVESIKSKPQQINTENTQNSTSETLKTSVKSTSVNSKKTETDKPIFKIQILTSDRILPAQNKLFKGLSPVKRYKENGIYKYTYGESTDYNYILRLKRNKVNSKFKDAFIIAFKNGKKMNINQAIKEFKNNK